MTTILFTKAKDFNCFIVHFLNIIIVSTGTLPHTCIFPQSSTAFLMLSISEALTQWPPDDHCQIDPNLVNRLSKFSELHHRHYVLLCAPMLGSNEQKVVSALQQKYMFHDLGFLPVHNSNECVECMSSIAKVACKSVSLAIRERIEQVQEQLISEEAILSIIQLTGVSRHVSTVLLDGCGSLAGIAHASRSSERLLDCSLDTGTVQSVQRFFMSHSQSN